MKTKTEVEKSKKSKKEEGLCAEMRKCDAIRWMG
jgi:hypothetical protein